MSLPALWESESFTQGSRSTDEVKQLSNTPAGAAGKDGQRLKECVGDFKCVFSYSAFRVCLWRTPVPVLRDLRDHAG